MSWSLTLTLYLISALYSGLLLIVYMAGSTNLSAAESNPVEDCQSHSDSLLEFLSRIGGHQG